MVMILALMKAPYSAILMLKCLDLHFEQQMVSHLGLMKELSWVPQLIFFGGSIEGKLEGSLIGA